MQEIFLSRQDDKINVQLLSAGFKGAQGVRAPHHVHVFSHMYDLCVPFSHFH